MSAHRLTRIIATVLCTAFPLSAGSSLQLSPGNSSTWVPDPNIPAGQPWRVEFQLHTWTIPSAADASAFIWQMAGLGADAQLLSQNYLRFHDLRDATSPSTCDLYLAGRTNILVRLQRDPVKARFVCEIWNSDGSGYDNYSIAIVTPQNPWIYGGGRFGSPNANAGLGFFRALPTILPDGSRPPTTATTESTLYNYAFDGNTLDSSGNHVDAVFPTAVFAPTPNQGPASIAQTANAPGWSTWTSVRAGFPAVLDATQSFSLADASSTVSYSWKQVSGPTTLVWSATNVAKPTVSGFIFGTYSVKLTVTDTALQTSSTTLTFGAVATDDNGVVVQSNPAADKIFGPMIAFGKNPWPWADQMTLHSAQVRNPELAAISPPAWAVPLPGTVSYKTGYATQPNQTSLQQPLSPTDMTITIADASVLDFSAFPTIVMIFSPGGWAPIEEVRICGKEGNTLSVCYDGRAWRAGLYERVAGPASWAVGANVRQVSTSGSGTKFLTNFCAAGVGEAGAINYSTGTVSATAGSNILTGSAETAWTSALEGSRIRVQGMHAGTPWVFFATIAQVTSSHTLTMRRPWPADATSAGSLNYAVLQAPVLIVRGWIRPDGTQGRIATNISSCESDTRMYQSDIFSGLTSTPQNDQPLSAQSTTWFSEYGPNYYDEVLAHYAGYLRSGYNVFLNNARMVGDYLPTAPDFDEGWVGMAPRHVGATGMVAAAVLDGRTNNWPTIRRLAANAIAGPYSGGAILPSCDADLRESAYGLSWIALAAMFDPTDTGDPNTPNQRSYWKAQLALALSRDQSCKGPNTEFPTAYWWGGSGAYAMTKGSATVTGTNITPAMCSVAATGTINVTNSIQAATGTGFVANTKIVVIGKRNGQPYLFYSTFVFNSASNITMSSPYDGDSGTYPYQIETDLGWLAFASDVSDHTNMNTLYACRWIDAGTIQLDRPWEAATGTYQSYRYQELGYGTQPFLAGIKTLAMNWAAQAATGSTASGYATLANGLANWVLTTGFDPATGGLHYARGWAGCEPNLNPRMNCTYSTEAWAKEAARTLNGEAQNAMRVAYEANPTATNKAFGDQFYGSQWGKLGGPYADSVYLTALDNDRTWDSKWLGFLFGIGMAHQWPAVRLGGMQPAVIKSFQIAYELPTGATSASIVVTQPNSATTTFGCSASPCQITADSRQGAHWYTVQYLNAAKSVVSSAAPVLLQTR